MSDRKACVLYHHAAGLHEEYVTFSSDNNFKKCALDLEERKKEIKKNQNQGNMVTLLYVISICAKNELDLKKTFEDKCMCFYSVC